jgi:hypothetical protein
VRIAVQVPGKRVDKAVRSRWGEPMIFVREARDSEGVGHRDSPDSLATIRTKSNAENSQVIDSIKGEKR